MLLTIAILSGIGYLISFISHLCNNKCDVNLIISAILVLSVWQSCFSLAIVVIILTLIIGILGFFQN